MRWVCKHRLSHKAEVSYLFVSLLPTGDCFCLGGLSASFILKKQRALLDLCPGGCSELCQCISVFLTPGIRSASNKVVVLFDITKSLFALAPRTLRHDCKNSCKRDLSYYRIIH